MAHDDLVDLDLDGHSFRSLFCLGLGEVVKNGLYTIRLILPSYTQLFVIFMQLLESPIPP